MKKNSLLGAPWAALLTEYLYERAPGIPEVAPYEEAARGYLKAHPRAVPDAVDAVIAKWGDRSYLEGVIDNLKPSLLEWARSKGMEVRDHLPPLYTTSN